MFFVSGGHGKGTNQNTVDMGAGCLKEMGIPVTQDELGGLVQGPYDINKGS